uniref:Uncharacterized protein n=1 Tax=Peronospora matthiolae TaxID=2874970 RepID=A0AAV1VKJ9_9STRA
MYEPYVLWLAQPPDELTVHLSFGSLGNGVEAMDTFMC